MTSLGMGSEVLGQFGSEEDLQMITPFCFLMNDYHSHNTFCSPSVLASDCRRQICSVDFYKFDTLGFY
jgi:hypothetical protein